RRQPRGGRSIRSPRALPRPGLAVGARSWAGFLVRVAPVQVTVRLVQAASDVLFDRFYRYRLPLRNLLIRAAVKDPQGKCRAALRWQALDSRLEEPRPLICKRPSLRGVAGGAHC